MVSDTTGHPLAVFTVVLIILTSGGLAAIGVFAGEATAQSGTTIIVDDDGGQDQTTIQAAVDNATNGDTIEVRAGQYDSVTISTANITITGPNSAIPGDSSSRNPEATIQQQVQKAVEIKANNVSVSGLEIKNPTGAGDGNTDVNAVGVKVQPASENVSVTNTTLTDIGTQSNTNVIGIYAERDTDGLTIAGNKLENLDGTDDDEDRTQAILLIGQEGGNTGSITGATISSNTITSVADTRSSKAIELNGDISANITDNDISEINTDGPAGSGFTQAIALGQGENANTGPSDVRIDDNSISNLETGSTGNFAPATHIIISAAGDIGTINISNNEFTPVSSDEIYVLDRASADFDLQTASGASTFETNAVTSVDGTDRALVPDTRVDVVNIDQQTGFNKIQFAVSNASSGDTIEIENGTFDESVTIDVQNVTIRAAKGATPTIVGDGESVGSQPHATIHVDDNSGPVRNVTIEGLTVRNPNGKFGIFAGTGSTNSDSDGIGGLALRDNVVEDVSTQSTGGSRTGGPAGIAIRGDYGTDGNPGIEIRNNSVSTVQTSSSVNAVGITLKSFTGDAGFGFDSSGDAVSDSSSPPATDTDILNNNITDIDGGDGSRTKGISVSGEFEDILIENNNISQISGGSSGTVLAITFSENGDPSGPDIDDDGNPERIGPRNFTVTRNTIDDTNAGDARSVNVGGYEDLGGDHNVTLNTIFEGALVRIGGDQPGYQIGDGDTLSAPRNYWNASDGPNGITSESNSNLNNPVTLPAGSGVVATTLGIDTSGNPQTGLIDVTPWVDAPVPSGSPTAVAENADTGTVHPTVQDAVDNAGTDDIIKIRNGTHNGSTTIDTANLTIEPAVDASPVLVGDGESVGNQPHATIHVDDGSGAVRNVTIEGLTVRNPSGKFGIFAGTGTTNSDPDGIGGLELRDNVVENVSTQSTGGSLTGGPAGIAIRGDYGTDGNPGIEIRNNSVSAVQTSGSVNAVGITLKSFTGDAGFGFDSSGSSVSDSSSPPATDTDILNNSITDIDGGDTSRTKGISVSGEFEDVRVEGSNISGITAASDGSSGNAFAITITENGGSYSGNKYDIDGDGNGERIGPRDINLSNNGISQVTADDQSAISIGGYEQLGNHAVSQNTIDDGIVRRLAGDQSGFQPGDEDALNFSNNTFTDQNAQSYFFDPSQSADYDTILFEQNNTFGPGAVEVFSENGPVLVPITAISVRSRTNLNPATSVTPNGTTSPLAGGQPREFNVTVSAAVPGLSERDQGDLDVEIVGIDSGESRIVTFEYNSSDITNNTLTVSKNETLTTPPSGPIDFRFPVLVTDLRRDNNPDLLTDVKIRVDAIIIENERNQESYNLSVTNESSTFAPGDTVGFKVTNASSGQPANASILFPGVTPQEANSTGTDGTVNETVTVLGKQEAVALPNTSQTFAPDTAKFTIEGASLGVNQSSVAFGDVKIGQSKTTSINITNTGSESVALQSLFVAGFGSRAFSVDESAVGTSLAGGTNRTTDITFTPVRSGDNSGTLVVNGERVTLNGTGTEPQISVNRTFTEITSQSGGSKNVTIAISNDGASDLNASITTNGDTGSFTQPGEVNVSAGATETFDVQFNANKNFAFQEIQIKPTADVPAVRLPVVGVVETSGVRFDRSRIDFGSVTTSDPTTRSVLVTNNGTTVETFNATTNQTANFTLAAGDRGNFTLVPGEEELLTVEADLSNKGNAVANLTVAAADGTSLFNNTPNATVVLNATARAPSINVVTSGPVDFGDIPTGSTATREVEIENRGTAPLTVELIDSFNSTEQQSFSIVGDETVIVPAGSGKTPTRNVTVAATPSSLANLNGNLTLNPANDPSVSEQNVSLEGAGISTNLSTQSTGTVTFGAIGVEGTATRTVTVTAGNIASVSATNDYSATISESDVEVTFTPTTNGTRIGTLTITGTNSDTLTRSLSGSANSGALDIDRTVIGTGAAETGTETSTGTVTIRNPESDTTLTVDEVTASSQFSHNTSGASDIANGTEISGGESGDIVIDFQPQNSGEQEGEVTINATSGDQTFNQTVTVFGFGIGAEPILETEDLSIGTVAVDETTTETVTIFNEGGVPFEIDTTNGSSAVTSTSVVGGSQVLPGGETTVDIVVNASTTGSISASANITTDTGTTLRVDVTGTATAPALDTGSLPGGDTVDFGSEPVGSSAQTEIELNNTGDATLVIATPIISGTDSADYRVLSGDQRLRIGPQSSKNISIGFAPDANEANRNATLEIDPVNDGDTDLQQISLTGDGSEGANATFDQSFVAFGSVNQDSSQTTTVTLSNDGTARLDILGSSITGADSGVFSVTNQSVSATLAPGASTTIGVEINTTGADRGGVGAQLDITTSDSILTTSLGGTVISPAIETESTLGTDAFPTTRVGDTSTATLQVNNTGNADLDLTDLTITGNNASAFSIVQPTDVSTNTTISPENDAVIELEFDPSAASNIVSNAQGSAFTADTNLTINSSDPDSPDQSLSVDVSAVAETTELIAPSNSQFGETPQGQTTTKQVEIENGANATAALNVTSLAVDGENSREYTAELNGSKETPFTLAPGSTVDLDVNLTPTSAGRKFATVTVETNDTRQSAAKVGVSNAKTTFGVSYGSIDVNYEDIQSGQTQPSVSVDRGFQGRNATLTSVNANVSNASSYSLQYTFNATDEGSSSVGGFNVSAFQYIDATTTASDQNFTESALQVELSKAALGSQNPDNVTIYHDKNDNGTYTNLTTTRLFETEQGHVYEVTTDSYSTFAIGPVESSSSTSGGGGDGDGDGDGDGGDNGDSGDDLPENADDDTGGGAGSGGGTDGVFTATELSQQRIEATEGDDITITANISTGTTLIQTRDVELRIDGQTVALRAVTLSNLNTTTVEFSDVDTSGLDGELEYTILTGSSRLTGTLVVTEEATEEPTETPTPTPTPTEEPTDTPTPTPEDGIPGFGLLVALVALVTAGLILARRAES